MTDENDTDELGDFDEFQNDDDAQDDDQTDDSNAHAGAVAAQLREADDEDLEAAGIDPDDVDASIAKDEDAVDDLDGRRTTIEPAPEPVDPLAEDFEVGDPAIDTATGRSVVIVGRAADRTDDHSDREGYDFLDNYGNERSRARPADPVYTAVYVSSLQSKPSKSYDFPSSRLGRPLYENVDGVDRVYQMVARDVLDKLFQTAKADGDALEGDDAEAVLANLARWSDVDVDVDEAEELARAEVEFGGTDE